MPLCSALLDGGSNLKILFIHHLCFSARGFPPFHLFTEFNILPRHDIIKKTQIIAVGGHREHKAPNMYNTGKKLRSLTFGIKCDGLQFYVN